MRSLLFFVAGASGFYLPGVAPREYADGDKVEIKVHKLSSPKTQLPYDYYSLPFCKPDEISRQAENLGEVMSGAIIQNSPYELYMGKVRTQSTDTDTRARRASAAGAARSGDGRSGAAHVFFSRLSSSAFSSWNSRCISCLSV